MKLTIVDVDIADFGQYKCVAKNSLGETDGSIKLYRKYHIVIIMKFLLTNHDLAVELFFAQFNT